VTGELLKMTLSTPLVCKSCYRVLVCRLCLWFLFSNLQVFLSFSQVEHVCVWCNFVLFVCSGSSVSASLIQHTLLNREE
jgi:hypothetical protein